MLKHTDATLRPICALILLQVCVWGLPGCGPQIVADFSVAERMSAQQSKDLFVYYKSWLSAECGQMQKEIESPRVQQLLVDKVLCILDEGYEPNRRFVNQYGVRQYPAIILIHPDRTYHSHVGQLQADQIARFISNAPAPGQTPRLDAQIPRSVDYNWHVQYETAIEQAKRESRIAFLFYKAVTNPDCNDVILHVLNRPDVSMHFDNFVNCRLDWGHMPNRSLMASFGVSNVPAFVIIRPDGTYHRLQGRISAEELLAFIHTARTKSGTPLPPSL